MEETSLFFTLLLSSMFLFYRPMLKFRIIILIADDFRIPLLFTVYMYSLLSIWLRMVALTENITNKILYYDY